MKFGTCHGKKERGRRAIALMGKKGINRGAGAASPATQTGLQTRFFKASAMPMPLCSGRFSFMAAFRPP
jgi:hypothetical protein